MTVVHQDLDGCVIVEIGGGYAVAVEWSCNARTGIERDVAKSAVVLVPIEEFRFSECIVETLAVDFGIDVTVGHEEVGPAVVIDVEEERAQSQELGILGQSGGRGDVGKRSDAVVVR